MPKVDLSWDWKLSSDPNDAILTDQYRGDIVGQKDQETKIILQVHGGQEDILQLTSPKISLL